MSMMTPRVHSRELLTTSDGWRLSLHRVRSMQPRVGPPVILVHGHGSSAWTFLGGRDGGLAGALASAGRDVWAVELRGSQETRHDRASSRVRISDKLGIDLPALITHVRDRTGSPCVDAVGHSMGGILLCLGALSRQDWPVRRIVTLGSPLVLSRAVIPRPFRGRSARALARRLGRIPLSELSARLSGRMATTWMPSHFDPSHIDEAVYRAFLRWGVTDVYGHELEELIHWVHRSDPRALLPEGCVLSRSRLPAPTRFLVGSHDPLTTPDAVRRTFERIGGSASDFIVIGKSSGFGRDYRHLDVLLASEVGIDVAPLIIDWLSRDTQGAWLSQTVPSPGALSLG